MTEELTKAQIKEKIVELSNQLAELTKLDRSSRVEKAKATKQARIKRKKELLDSYTTACEKLIEQHSELIRFSAVVTHTSATSFSLVDGKLRVLLDMPHGHDRCPESYAGQCTCELCQHIDESRGRMIQELNEAIHLPRLRRADKNFNLNDLFRQAWEAAQKSHKSAGKQQGQSDTGESVKSEARS